MADFGKRLDKLERTTGSGDDVPIVVVDWGDGVVTVDGEELTTEEFRKRYPDVRVVDWVEDYVY